MILIVIADLHGNHKYLPNLKYQIDQIISAARVSKEPILLVHVGDWIGANRLLSSFSVGEFDIAATKSLTEAIDPQYRFYVIGNHDTLYGEAKLKKFIEETKFSAIGSNVTLKDDSILNGKIAPAQIVKLETGQLIGLFGLLTPETLKASGQKFAAILDLPSSIEKIVAEIMRMNKEGVHDFLVMSHLGIDTDKALAGKILEAKCDFTNLYICGGHSHTPTLKAISFTSGVKTIHLINAGFDGLQFAVLTLDEKLALKTPFVLQETISNVNKGPRMEALIREWGDRFLAQNPTIELNKVLFTVKNEEGNDLSGLDLDPSKYEKTVSHLRVNDSFITRLTADAIASATGADIALFPAAGFRSNYSKGQKVTYGDLYEMYLANNRILVVEVTGKDIVRALALGERTGYQHWVGRGSLLHPSTRLGYSYDCQKSPEKVIEDVCFDGEPIYFECVYRVAITDWMLNVAKLFKDAKLVEDKKQLSQCKICDMVHQYILQYPIVGEVQEHFGQRIKAPSFRVQEEMRRELEEKKGIFRNNCGIATEVPIHMPLQYRIRLHV